MISDVELKRRAEAEIAAALGDDACDLAVAVKDAVATLSGFVKRYSDACIAEHAARKAGVRGIANEIEVRLPLVDRRSDPEIARAALKALEAEDLGVAERLFVRVKNGVLTLEGSTESAPQRVAAERVVRRLKGLKGLVNQIRVEPPKPASEAPAPTPRAPEEARSFAEASDPEPAISALRVREVVGVVDSQEELDALVNELTTHGVDRTDISLMGTFSAVFHKLKKVYRRPDEVADLPDVPRRSLVTRDDVFASTALVFGTLLTVGSFGAALPVVASGGALAAAIAAAVGGGAAAGALARIIRDKVINPRDAARLEDDLMSGGLVVFVRVDTSAEEANALKIMREVGADNVHVHEIDVGRRRDDLPLSAVQPLFDEALPRAETTR
ncbi:transport-associated protein(predicted periplasmic or secreted lipoprotein) (plasmid) [Phenylobacterium zucineum HLK1]|jgi:osmotically-inducible protein OsmY|uniref:Transport-associated protein(Predicted periplasmic or secreted lipoprotein) n=1 Tax=Phenylobacterium zucineum (strain HLK1) TaxID=450851 RepID=B4RI71_PHEZH|nr:BON domain-containing protein [Phenylobacterium zucineum]ACG80046.1 transport-associated protein(predicted periplasmic or secreted lipoprotein) [Phenylobacterium zucineum HLK1]